MDALDDFVIGSSMQRDLQDPASPLAGREPAGAAGRAGAAARAGADARLDAAQRPLRRPLRGATRTASRWQRLEAAPHGIDLGPLEPRIPEVLRTPSGKIELAPEPIVADVERLTRVACGATATAGWC